ncbi:hypothetical protein ES705_21879 [subsurface metagenome]
MRIFLSYSNMDKKLAGKIKSEFEKYYFTVFLAHDDISPSVEWIEKIIRELKRCHIFIPVLTNHFKNSDWTNQESGIAHILKKMIVPLKIHINPYGFISRFQAFSLKPKAIVDSCNKLVLTLAERPKVGNFIRDSLVRRFGDSNSYDDAASNAKALVRVKKYTRRQINQVIKHAVSNRQIHDSRRAMPIILDFFRKNKKYIGTRLSKAFKALGK